MKKEIRLQKHKSPCNIDAIDNGNKRVIRLQQGLTQFEIKLNEDDAIMFMLILKRNNVWFADITK